MQQGLWYLVMSVCLSVKLRLTSGVSVHPEKLSRTQRAMEVKKICGIFSETTLLQRSSTAPLKAIHMVGHFPAESVHVDYSIYHVSSQRQLMGTEGSALYCIHFIHGLHNAL